MHRPVVSILIPNYKTPEVTKLCLRMLRKNTDPKKIRVIAIDNNSADASLDYLKTLSWIELIERKEKDASPSQSESRALDLALGRVDTPYVLAIHTDTMILQPGWLDILLAEFAKEPNIAGVGSWKLEEKPSILKCAAKQMEYRWRITHYTLTGNKRKARKARDQMDGDYYKFFGSGNPPISGQGKEYYFLRSHCAMYRMDVIRKYNLTFSHGGETASKGMSKFLVDQGHKLVYLPARHLGEYLIHLNHATMIFHPELGSGGGAIAKGMKRIRRILKELNADEILADDSLDL